VLSNHDQPRHRTRYGGRESRARAAAVLLLTLEGTPFVYAGEELGLQDAVVPEDRVVDPGGRDGCRAPLPWDESPRRGWSGEPWLPWPRDVEGASADRQREDAGSVLHLYRRLLAERRASPALALGTLSLVPSPDGVLVFDRTGGDDVRRVVVNFADVEAEVVDDGDWVVRVSSDGRREGGRFDGQLEPDQAVVLGRPG
jgi:alpha-glucosidase